MGGVQGEANNVLAVEDSEVMRGMIVKALKNGGLPVTELYQTANRLEGLQSVREHSVDLVFMDLNTPVMDGETFLRKIRVVVSSNGSSPIGLGPESLSATFIRKPFTAQTLRAAAENALGARQ